MIAVGTANLVVFYQAGAMSVQLIIITHYTYQLEDISSGCRHVGTKSNWFVQNVVVHLCIVTTVEGWLFRCVVCVGKREDDH